MSVVGLMNDVADALRTIQLEIPDLQVYPYWNDNPSPPALDCYPASPFQIGAGMNLRRQVFLTVRARVTMADPESAQTQLLRMLDTDDPASVEKALEQVATIPENAPVGGFRQYSDDSTDQGERLLGCEWTVTAFL